MVTLPLRKKGKHYFAAHQTGGSTLLKAALHSPAFPCRAGTGDTSWAVPAGSWQLSVLWSICGQVLQGQRGLPQPHQSHHILPQMLLKRANSACLSAAHSKDSTPDTFNSLFRFSSFITTQQGMGPCKWILIKIYYKFINFSPRKHGLEHPCKQNRNLPLKFTTELVSKLSLTMSSETKENQPIK